MESEELIREIVSQSEDEFAGYQNEHRLLPRTTLVNSGDIGRFKVRLYPNEESARKQEQIISRVRNGVPMPKLVGRDGPFLVFQYFSLEGTSAGDLLNTASGIGSILRDLSKYKPIGDELIDLDGEFESWLRDLLSAGFLSKGVVKSISQRYHDEKPKHPIICLDYWDAISHNFGQHGGKLYLLDEKHLRYSYACVGLVKPSLLMDKDHFSALLRGYGEGDTLQFYRTYRRFLLLYYLVAALHFYAQKQQDGFLQIPANSRLRYYRGSLIRMIWRSPVRRVLEALAFTIRYPSSAIHAFVRRLSGPINLQKLARRFLLDVQPWDENAL
jgi:hypothetical protein